MDGPGAADPGGQGRDVDLTGLRLGRGSGPDLATDDRHRAHARHGTHPGQAERQGSLVGEAAGLGELGGQLGPLLLGEPLGLGERVGPRLRLQGEVLQGGGALVGEAARLGEAGLEDDGLVGGGALGLGDRLGHRLGACLGAGVVLLALPLLLGVDGGAGAGLRLGGRGGALLGAALGLGELLAEGADRLGGLLDRGLGGGLGLGDAAFGLGGGALGALGRGGLVILRLRGGEGGGLLRLERELALAALGLGGLLGGALGLLGEASALGGGALRGPSSLGVGGDGLLGLGGAGQGGGRVLPGLRGGLLGQLLLLDRQPGELGLLGGDPLGEGGAGLGGRVAPGLEVVLRWASGSGRPRGAGGFGVPVGVPVVGRVVGILDGPRTTRPHRARLGSGQVAVEGDDAEELLLADQLRLPVLVATAPPEARRAAVPGIVGGVGAHAVNVTDHWTSCGAVPRVAAAWRGPCRDQASGREYCTCVSGAACPKPSAA